MTYVLPSPKMRRSPQEHIKSGSIRVVQKGGLTNIGSRRYASFVVTNRSNNVA